MSSTPLRSTSSSSRSSNPSTRRSTATCWRCGWRRVAAPKRRAATRSIGLARCANSAKNRNFSWPIYGLPPEPTASPVMGIVGAFRGLVRASARAGDDLCRIGGSGCPYTLPIGGRPLVCHAVKALADGGIDQILVAVDVSIADEVAPILGEFQGADVHVAIQADNDEDATLRAVDKVLGPGPIAFAAGDALSELHLDESEPAPDTVIEAEALWRYDGTVDGLLEANTLALDGLKRGRGGVDLANATVQGRVHIDPSAELDGAKIRGPAYIGPGVRLVETYVGPYTTVAEGATMEGVEIENSLVLERAEIRYPGRRLEGSMVGEGAQISRDFSLPSALRLRVGPGAEIQLS